MLQIFNKSNNGLINVISRYVCSLLSYFTHVNIDNDVYAGPVAYCNSRSKRVVVNKVNK